MLWSPRLGRGAPRRQSRRPLSRPAREAVPLPRYLRPWRTPYSLRKRNRQRGPHKLRLNRVPTSSPVAMAVCIAARADSGSGSRAMAIGKISLQAAARCRKAMRGWEQQTQWACRRRRGISHSPPRALAREQFAHRRWVFSHPPRLFSHHLVSHRLALVRSRVRPRCPRRSHHSNSAKYHPCMHPCRVQVRSRRGSSLPRCLERRVLPQPVQVPPAWGATHPHSRTVAIRFLATGQAQVKVKRGARLRARSCCRVALFARALRLSASTS